MSFPFVSLTDLEQTFSTGLARLLSQHSGLGVYILVLANAAYDPAVWKQLSAALAARHDALAAALAHTLRTGTALTEPDDDVMVFLKLQLIGFTHLGLRETRQDGPWLASYNPLRALRPPRTSRQPYTGLERPFDAAGFHFNRAFLGKEILWEGALAGQAARLLYNKFPFARLHGLLVPAPAREQPQTLTPAWHHWAWTVCAESECAGLTLGYNSAGAGASVNHLHFQSFVQTPALPIFDPRFTHNGGAEVWPLPCVRFSDAETAWTHIAHLHREAQPYNLIYTRGSLLCVARAPQDSPRLDDVCRSYGWSEMAGAVTLFNRDDYTRWQGADLAAQLARFAPG